MLEMVSGLKRYALLAGLLIVASLAGYAAVQRHRVATLEQQNGELALQHANDSAQKDVTFRVSDTNAKLAAAAGDTVAVYKRLVVQTDQRADSIDRALGLERRGRYAMTLRLDSLQRTNTVAVVTSDSTDRVRRASFDVRQAPYTVALTVELPAAPDTAHLDLRVALDPIPVTARLSCAAPDSHGIRAASIEAQTPKWAAVNFDHVEQSPDLCASRALTKASGRRLVRFAPLVIGGGLALPSTHRVGWAGFIGSGFAIGGL